MYSPQEIAQNYIGVAKAKTSMPWYKMLLLAILAGAFIAFGGAAATAASANLSGSVAALVKGAVFPVGLILVVVCGAELFTGNCLLISPLVGKDIKVGKFFKSWGIVYIGNLVGGILIAALVVDSHVQSDAMAHASVATLIAKCNMSFGDAFVRGVLCNILVCLAVWASMACKSTGGKILAVYFPVLAFVVCGFEHSIANAYYLTAGFLTSVDFPISAAGITVGQSLLYCLLPSTLGNIVGGCTIGLIYHAVYRTKMPKREESVKEEAAPAVTETKEEAVKEGKPEAEAIPEAEVAAKAPEITETNEPTEEKNGKEE